MPLKFIFEEKEMKKFTILLAIFTAFVFGAVQTAYAQDEQKATIKFGKQKKFSQSKLTVKFLSVTEDSRCPQGVNCIQAGNARIKVEISNGTTKEIFEMNTFEGPKGASFSGFAIYLDELLPMTKANTKINQKDYKGKFRIVRLTR
jgi:hypothetical protein